MPSNVDNLAGWVGATPPDDPYDDYDEPAGASWAPVDLAPVLSGAYRRTEPSIGIARTDGLRFVYPGKEHTIIGEMESGKSWLLVAAAAAELLVGEHVVYIHFEEADAVDTVERLRELQVPDDVILARFHFVGPDEPVTPSRLAALLDPVPSLVVLDGVNEAMSLHTMAIRDEDGVAAFRKRLVKPCTRAGAAVLAADHVVKDRERRDRGPLGSIHKGNGLTGSLILLENVAAFGRGQRGVSHVFVTKDRPGHLRRYGRPSRLPGKTFIGTLVVDDTRTWAPFLELSFLEPTDDTDTDDKPTTQDERDDEQVLAVVAGLASTGEVNLRTVRAKSAGLSNARVDNALVRLTLDGRLTERPGSNRARLFSVPQGPPSPVVSNGAVSVPVPVPLEGGAHGHTGTPDTAGVPGTPRHTPAHQSEETS